MLHWMSYATLLAALFGVGAAAAERAARGFRLPARPFWAGALALSLLAPAVLLLLPADVLPVTASAPVAVVPSSGFVAPLPHPAPHVVAAEPSWAVRLDAQLPRLWGAGSLLVALVLLLAQLRLVRERWRWRNGRIGRARVWVSRDTGPAAAGIFRPEVVVPERVFAWGADALRLVLEHEREHIRARDPLLVASAWLAVLLCPWNVALWWQLRRLRLAVETDCDARVLRHRPDVRRYAALLLEVGRLASGVRLPLAAFSHPRSLLARRIDAMTRKPLRHPLRAALPLLAVGILGVVAAAAVPIPARPELKSTPRGIVAVPAPADTTPRLPVDSVARRLGAIDISRVDRPPRLVDANEVREARPRAYPPLLRAAGVRGTATVRLVIDAQGNVAAAEVVRATRPEFRPAAREVLLEARFVPAQKAGAPVATETLLPVVFSPPAGSAAAPGSRSPDHQIRSAVLRRYPTLATERTGRKAYVWLIFDRSGEVRQSALDRTPPAVKRAPEALYTRFPALHPDEIVSGGISSYRPGLVGPDSLVVFWGQRASGEGEAHPLLGPPPPPPPPPPPASVPAPPPSSPAPPPVMDWRRQSEAMRAETARMHAQWDSMQARFASARTTVRGVAQRLHPEVLRSGLPSDQYLWVVTTPEGAVLRSGVQRIRYEPSGAWSTASVARQLRDEMSYASVGNVMIMMGVELAPRSESRFNVALATLEPDRTR